MFTEISNRDAWSTLRGFVYQVDTTILRWMTLYSNQVLELEKGEDIDIINRSLENKELSRELEQIKYRETNITLNQEEVLEILFNFFLHRKNNPTYDILFRYVSNASYTTERPALFENGKGGIEAWGELFSMPTNFTDDTRFIVIQNHLQKKIGDTVTKLEVGTKDSELLQHWKDFKSHIEQNESLASFIRSFEWSMKNDMHEQISETIKDKLLKSGYVPDIGRATLLYSRLFLHVFKVLSISGLKQLDKAEFISHTKLPDLNTADQELLNFVTGILQNIESRIHALEASNRETSFQLSTLLQDVQQIAKSDTVFEYRLKNLSTRPPALVQQGTVRVAKVEALSQLHQVHPWIGLQGINGTGKSQLAALVCSKHHNFYWLDLRDYNKDSETTTLLVETFFSHISHCPIYSDRDRWMSEVLYALTPHTLIVLNDLPRIEKNSALSQLLIGLGQHLGSAKIKLLTTSNFPVPSYVVQSLTAHPYAEYTDLEFTDQEIIEYLVNSGADDSIANYVGLIANISHRNPQLVSAIIYHLKEINWGKNTDTLFETLFNREFSTEVLEDAQQAIGKFITNEHTRELLYRLSLIHWGIQLKEIVSISEVEQKILHPNEKLQQLVNIWVQKQDDSYHVSPLIRDLGESNLPLTTVQQVHLTIAHAILSKKTLNPISATRCMTSFINGNDYNNAGSILLNFYRTAQTKEEVIFLEQWGFLYYWKSTDIPKAMNTVLRAFIRVEQIRLFRLNGMDTSALLQWLTNYLTEESLSIHEETIIRVLCLINFEGYTLDSFFYNINFVLEHWRVIAIEVQEEVPVKVFFGLIWSPIAKITSEKEIKQWMGIIQLIEQQFEIDVFDRDLAQDAVTILSNKIANSENGKPDEEKDWSNVLNRLELLHLFLKQRGKHVLAAVVMKDIVYIEFVLLKNLERAYNLTTSALEETTSEEARYLLCENLGKIYFNNDRKVQAKEWLLEALSYDGSSHSTYTDTLIYGAAVVSDEDPTLAESFCQKAVAIVEKKYTSSLIIYVQVLGELAIAHWIKGDYASSFACFEKVVTNLFELKEEQLNSNWIRVLSWTGHSLGYIAAMVADKKVPEFVEDGSAYTKPYQGIYSFNNKDLTDLYKQENEPVILANLAIFADGVNDMHKAYYWSLKAFDLARKNGNPKIIYLVTSVCGPYSLIHFKLEEAFEANLLFAAVATHLKGSPEEKHKRLTTLTSLTDILSSKPSVEWNESEQFIVGFSIVPLFILVLTAQLENWDDKNERAEEFLNMLRNYIRNASDRTMWEVLLELCRRILSKSITEKELTDRANTFGQGDYRHLHFICILGVISHAKNYQHAISGLLNILPNLVMLFDSTRSVIKFVILPFVRNRCIHILEETFVGTKAELHGIINEIESVDITDRHAIQLMLQPVVREMEVTLPHGRERWLNEFKKI